jgi:hypothetical protein
MGNLSFGLETTIVVCAAAPWKTPNTAIRNANKK